jgi:hypothetical protein
MYIAYAIRTHSFASKRRIGKGGRSLARTGHLYEQCRRTAGWLRRTDSRLAVRNESNGKSECVCVCVCAHSHPSVSSDAGIRRRSNNLRQYCNACANFSFGAFVMPNQLSTQCRESLCVLVHYGDRRAGDKADTEHAATTRS